MSIQEIREDIKGLRGATVSVFGQPTTLDEDYGEEFVDILDILDNVENNEVSYPYTYEEYNEETDDYDEITFETVDEYLSHLEEMGDIKEISSDNSYNWGGKVSHDFNIYLYEDLRFGGYYVDFKVHRFGDVRANYTVNALLKFDFESEFLEKVVECNKSISVGDYEVIVSALNDGYEVYNDGYYVETIHDIDDFREKNKLEKAE